MRVFVAGGGGLVGSAVLKNAPPEFEVLHATREQLNLLDIEALKKYLKANRVNSIIMAAAIVGGIHANKMRQKDFLLENLKLQNSMFQAAFESDIENLVFLGSSCVYPKLSRQPISESSLMTGLLEETNEGYGLAKITGIKICKEIYLESNRNFFSLMPTNLYGPNDNFSKLDSHVPAALMRRFHEAKLKNEESVEVWGSGKALREFLHSHDLASACWYFLNRPMGGELINIGSGYEITIRDFARLMARVIGFEGRLQFDSSKPEGVSRKLLDITKASSLGWNASIGLEDGLRSTYDWFQGKYSKGQIRGF